MHDLGRKLRWLRASTGLDQAAFAEAIGVNQATVAKWEGGKRVPHRSSLAGLSVLMGIPVQDLDRFLRHDEPLRKIPMPMQPWLAPPGPAELSAVTVAELEKLLGDAKRSLE